MLLTFVVLALLFSCLPFLIILLLHLLHLLLLLLLSYIKGTDTLDVWFDSGVSWASVLGARGIPLPADMYLEGR
jgi:hypothetical protein